MFVSQIHSLGLTGQCSREQSRPATCTGRTPTCSTSSQRTTTPTTVTMTTSTAPSSTPEGGPCGTVRERGHAVQFNDKKKQLKQTSKYIFFSCRTRPDCVCPSGRAEVTRLPQGSTQARHRYRQHTAEATAETAGVLPLSQKRSVFPL